MCAKYENTLAFPHANAMCVCVRMLQPSTAVPTSMYTLNVSIMGITPQTHRVYDLNKPPHVS